MTEEEGQGKDLTVARADSLHETEASGVQAMIYQAISVQRPAVLQYLMSLRRDKPEATPSEILTELEKRYVTAVTVASTGVGASAAIPGVGIPLALGLGAADLLFFYETSALFVLAVTELHGIEVTDAARSRPLVIGMLLGEKSQSAIQKVVMGAAGAGNVAAARDTATAMLEATLPKGWGEALTTQVPDTALGPLGIVIAKQGLKEGGKLGAGTLGKALPFGVGAVIGGVGSFTFGRDVVKASRIAFPETPEQFPPSLANFEKPDPDTSEPSRASQAMSMAAQGASEFGGKVRSKAVEAVNVFRSVDLDADGVPDEARAVTAAKKTGSAVKGVAGKGVGAVGSVLRRKGKKARDDDAPEGESQVDDAADDDVMT
ncbi:hypothetical protein ACSDQ9_12940 [Aestuariimicrobium soli]|uniref:hypothetical protein n=1 Tax=Aestuariimicrobium soli TaxID=2035834 RepID=UPI003EB80648